MRPLALPFFGDGDSDGKPRLASCCPNQRSRVKCGLQATVLILHVIFISALFLIDGFLMEEFKEHPWYTTMYMVLSVVTMIQYVFTSCSSPGYVVDAMKATHEAHATFVNVSNKSRIKGLDSTKVQKSLLRQNFESSASPWLNIVMQLYPPGQSVRNWTCIYCNIIQPPRTKHCNECHKCVLQFDHHCAWLGTCIGRENHCRFWWYIFEETILCIWTGTLYFIFLQSNANTWWKDFILIVLLALLISCFMFLLLLLLFHSYLLLTNQTTYEILRRRRILYLREIPESVHPFSRGICRNLCTSCCSRDSVYTLEAIPSLDEIEARATTYTYSDIIACRCC